MGLTHNLAVFLTIGVDVIAGCGLLMVFTGWRRPPGT